MSQMKKVEKMVDLLKEVVTKEYPQRKWTTEILVWEDDDFRVIIQSGFFGEYAHFIEYKHSTEKTYIGLRRNLVGERMEIMEKEEIHGSDKPAFKKWLKKREELNEPI